MSEYKRWCEKVTDNSLVRELDDMSCNEALIEDAFYRNLSFGTGGLRGIIGAGTNRMNIYTVAKASQGLADYIIDNYLPTERCIAISFDSRVKSEEFAKTAASVFAANGIKVYIYTELMPTPCLSYAVRYYGCAAGVMVTASHNPSKYNGYKVYGQDGCQITDNAAKDILAKIDRIDIFADVRLSQFEKEIEHDMIEYISDDVYTSFVNNVKKQSVLYGDIIDKNVAIIYTPLNGTGLKPILRTLKESGYTNITVVKEQEKPDGDFLTCPYPNPEVEEAMLLGLEYARKKNADLLIATDPDCDRVGIAVKDINGIRKDAGDYVLLSGNEVGMLLLDYICSQRVLHGTMPENPVFMKTIVTTDLGERIAAHYGLKTIDVLTGFKYIGEQIGYLENVGKEDSFVFGFEESYGYLSGTYVRDKDAVVGTFLICEMFSFYKSKGICLLDKLEELYNEYGYCINTLHSYQFEGSAGLNRMKDIMDLFRNNITDICDIKIKKIVDYSKGIDKLPKSDVLKFYLDDNNSVVVRPSGTEPKIKIYISISSKNYGEIQSLEKNLVKEIEKVFIYKK